jgi:acetyltransferase-like isoleucine patch superfamily enzyme/intracellular sulfur oxidation DsrE/DsrF family protein
VSDLTVVVAGDAPVDAFVASLQSLDHLLAEAVEVAVELICVAPGPASTVVRRALPDSISVLAQSEDRTCADTGLAAANGAQRHVLVAGELLPAEVVQVLCAKCGAVPHSLRASSGNEQALDHRLRDLGLALSGQFDGTVDEVVLEGPTELHAGLEAFSPMHVGAFTYSWSRLTGAVGRVGRYCSIARGVSFGESEHPLDGLSTSPFGWDDGKVAATHMGRTGRTYNRRQLSMRDYHAPVSIGNDVWIGAQAYIRGGVSLGDGCVIGTNAVVTRDVPPYAIVVGNPGRVVRYRFEPDVVDQLLDLAWWRYDCADFDGFDLSDVAVAIETIRARVAAGTIQPYGGQQRSLGSLVRLLQS